MSLQSLPPIHALLAALEVAALEGVVPARGCARCCGACSTCATRARGGAR
ncbi:MAG: hypothetical protein U0325_31705 [Polyangiales bacterium]